MNMEITLNILVLTIQVTLALVGSCIYMLSTSDKAKVIGTVIVLISLVISIIRVLTIPDAVTAFNLSAKANITLDIIVIILVSTVFIRQLRNL